MINKQQNLSKYSENFLIGTFCETTEFWRFIGSRKSLKSFFSTKFNGEKSLESLTIFHYETWQTSKMECFCERLKPVNYFCKTSYLRCFTWIWIRLWLLELFCHSAEGYSLASVHLQNVKLSALWSNWKTYEKPWAPFWL